MISKTTSQISGLLLPIIAAVLLIIPTQAEAGSCTMNFKMRNDSNKPVTILKVQVSASKAITYGAWGSWKKVTLKGFKHWDLVKRQRFTINRHYVV